MHLGCGILCDVRPLLRRDLKTDFVSEFPSKTAKLPVSCFSPSFVLGPTKWWWDQQQHPSGEHRGVGGWQCGLWGKVEGSSILLGLLEVIFTIFSLSFGFASPFSCVFELSGCWWDLGWAFTCGFLAVRGRTCWTSPLFQAPCSAVVFHLTPLQSLTEEWAEHPRPLKMRVVPHLLLFLLSASPPAQFSHFRRHSVMCHICYKSNIVAPPSQFSPPKNHPLGICLLQGSK